MSVHALLCVHVCICMYCACVRVCAYVCVQVCRRTTSNTSSLPTTGGLRGTRRSSPSGTRNGNWGALSYGMGPRTGLPCQFMHKKGQTSLQTRVYADSIGLCERRRIRGAWALRGRQLRPLLRPGSGPGRVWERPGRDPRTTLPAPLGPEWVELNPHLSGWLDPAHEAVHFLKGLSVPAVSTATGGRSHHVHHVHPRHQDPSPSHCGSSLVGLPRTELIGVPS